MTKTSARRFPKSLSVLLLSTALGLGCGGTSKKDADAPYDVAESHGASSAGDTGNAGAKAGPTAHRFDLGTHRVDGRYFAPTALAPRTFPMTFMTSRSVDEQRALYQAATGSRKVREGEALAVLLLARPADRAEARTVLQEVVAGGKAPESTYAKLAVAVYLTGDLAGCAGRYDELIKKFPRSADLATYKTRRAFLALVRGDNAGAAKLVEGMASKKAPAGAAYVDAWLRLRRGDAKAAFAAMVVAAKRWPDSVNLTELRGEITLFAAAAGADPAKASAALRATVKHDGAEMSVLLAELAQAYRAAGRYQLAIDAAELGAAGARPEVLAQIRADQGAMSLALNRPVRAADFYAAAWVAATDAGDDLSDRARAALADDIGRNAIAAASVYARTGDASYADAGAKLLATYAEIPGRADAGTAQASAETLAERTAPETGAYSEEMLRATVVVRHAELTGCFERGLQANAQLYGDVAVTLEFATAGTPSVMTDPPAGREGLGLVAACIGERVGGWNLPTLTGKSTTTVTLALELKPKS